MAVFICCFQLAPQIMHSFTPVTSAPLTLTGNEVISIKVISENILVHLCSVKQRQYNLELM